MPDNTQESQNAEAQAVQDIVDLHPEIEALSAGEHEQVMQALHDHAADGTLPDLNVDHEVLQAEVAHDHQQHADALQAEQVEAIAAGDMAHAHELAGEAAWDLSVAQEQGGHVGDALVEAQQDTASLDWAAHHEAIATENAAAAADYAAHGDLDHAADYAHVADGHAETAGDYGHAADHGGAAEAHADAAAPADTSAEATSE